MFTDIRASSVFGYAMSSVITRSYMRGRIYAILAGAGFNGTLSVVFEGKGINRCDDRQVLSLAAAQLRRLSLRNAV